MPRERNQFPRGAVLQAAPQVLSPSRGDSPMQPATSRQAFAAFQTQKPDLLARGYQGQWALFRGDQCVMISRHRDDLHRRVDQEGFLEHEIFIDMIVPEPEAFEEECLLSR